jgi:hypothetical protein
VVEITPEPEPGEQEAILAALAAEEGQHAGISPWAEALLPARAGEQEEP